MVSIWHKKFFRQLSKFAIDKNIAFFDIPSNLEEL
jgi:hypothetical protein